MITSGSGKHAKNQTIVDWLVRKSSDAGQSWTIAGDVSLNGAYPDAAAVVPKMGVVVVGSHYNSNGWIVRQSLNGEQGTWTTVDGPYPQAAAHGVCSDGAGNIYVVGEKFVPTGTYTYKKQTQTTGYYTWAMRVHLQDSDFSQWQDVETDPSFYPNTGDAARAYGIAADKNGNVVAVGLAFDGSYYHWIVRAFNLMNSKDGWTTVDDFQPSAGAAACGIARDSAGDLMVTGWANYGNGSGAHLVVRMLPASAQ